MICPHCGATLSSAARFCTQCGQTLAVAAANSNDNVEDSTVLGTAPHGTAAAPQPEAPAPVAAFPEPVPAPQAAAPQPVPAPQAAAPQPVPAPQAAAPQPVPAPQAAAPQPEPAPAFPGAEQPAAEPAFPAVPEPVPAQEAPAAPVPAAEVPVAAPAGEVPAAAPVAAAAPAPGTFVAPAPGAPVPGAPAPVTPGAPVQPGAPQQFVPNPMFKELFSARSLQTSAISLAFGLIGAMALALIGSIFFLSAGSSWASKLSMVPGLSGMMSDASGSGTVTPNFFQFLILVMVLGVSGQLSPNITGGNLSMSSFGVSGHLWMPVGLPGVALVLGTAFGAYWFARKFAIRFKWTGIVSSVIVGVVMGFVYLILAAIFPLTLGAGSMGGIQAKAILTGVSARTYFMTLLLAAIGAFFGYLLAQYASDSNNVFTAAWKWAHRTRGFVRTLLDAAFIYAVVFTVIGFICLIMLSSNLHNGQMFMLFPILLPYLSFLTFALGSFGAVGIDVPGYVANLSLFGISNQYGGSISAPWQLWLVFVVFLITTFYIALRAAARNIYDPAYAGWQHSWKSPVATLVIWLIVTFLFTSVTLDYTMQSDTSDVSLNIAAWYFLVAAVWSFLIEVVALTFGPAMVLSMGGAWKLFVGGTVRPTPAEVTAYAAACGAHFGRFPSQVAAAVGYTGPQQSFGGQPGAGTGAPTAPAAGVPVQGVPVQGVPVQGAPVPGAPVQGVPAAGTDAAAFQAQGGAPTVQVPAGAPAAPAAAPVAPVPVAAPAAPAAAKAMTPQQKKLAIIISAIVGVLALLGIAYAVVNSTVFSADNTVKSYLSAIASGDYDKANGISDPQVANGKRTLLTNAASKGDKTTISNQRIISATDNADGSRTMRISYTLGGKSMTDILTVAPNGSKFLIFKNWNITTPLVKEISVYASPAITNFTVNGVKVGAKNATASDSGTYTFKVYPGSYTVEPVTSKYLTADSTTLTTSFESSASISAEPTDALADEINAKIKDKLDTCAKSTDAQPEGCPFSMYGSDDDYRNIAWNITEYPTVTTDDLSIDSGSFYVYGGEAKVAYEYKNYDDSWEPTDSSTSFSISGQFTLDGDKLDITLDDD
ncbi:zinc-ribbon domain-containing protein [Bifidobacterium bifidum]|uniref:zinc ribbon domain-containing protein n=1 Tax=Bifidobacterium bifidum TaxID=1681 RepID=UPI003B9AE0E6